MMMQAEHKIHIIRKFKTTTLKSKMQKILMVLDYYAKTFRSFDQYHTDAN